MKPTAKEVSVSRRRQKAMQLADYKWMAEKGLSPEAKRYRDEYIRPKKKDTEENNDSLRRHNEDRRI